MRGRSRRSTMQDIKGVGAFLLYVFLSGGMVFANKAIFEIGRFDASNALLLVQMIITVPCLSAAKALGLTSFPPFEIGVARRILPVSVLYSAHACVALLSLKDLNVAAYSIVKRVTPIVLMLLEIPLRGVRISLPTWISVAAMCLGTVITAGFDADSPLSAYGLGFLSCILQAGYLIFVAKSNAESGLGATGVMFCHSLLSIPLLLPLCVVTGELEYLLHFPRLFDPEFQAALWLLLTMSLLLNYSVFCCTSLNSPLTTTVAGHVKSIITIIGGLFTFGGVRVTAGFACGAMLNIVGGGFYAWIKWRESAQQKSLQKQPTPLSSSSSSTLGVAAAKQKTNGNGHLHAHHDASSEADDMEQELQPLVGGVGDGSSSGGDNPARESRTTARV